MAGLFCVWCGWYSSLWWTVAAGRRSLQNHPALPSTVQAAHLRGWAEGSRRTTLRAVERSDAGAILALLLVGFNESGAVGGSGAEARVHTEATRTPLKGFRVAFAGLLFCNPPIAPLVPEGTLPRLVVSSFRSSASISWPWCGERLYSLHYRSTSVHQDLVGE